MDLDFVHDGHRGRVSVCCLANDDPATVGKPAGAKGFPVCTATVDFPARGYRSLFGWIQLVRSTDNATAGQAFEIDPFVLFEDSTAPYCWYGTKPTLFDAPSRGERRRLEWTAHSFLATSPLDREHKLVLPLVGFSWGFTVDERGAIDIPRLHRLPPTAWDDHLPYLRRQYGAWGFHDSTTMT